MTPHDETAKTHSTLGFRIIGAMKILSGLALAAAGFGIFRMLNRDLGASIEELVKKLHLDPENRIVQETVSRVGGISRGQLKAIGAGTFFYAILHLIEGTGLILLKPWAEYLTVIATASLLPLELYELSRKVSLVRVGVLTLNLIILAYIVFKLRQQHRSREVS